MKYFLVILLALTVTVFFGNNIQAQSSGPIFINPMQQPQSTPTNNLPTVVTSPRNTNSSRSRTTAAALAARNANRTNNSSYTFVDLKNPYEGTAFGRIRTEKDYYDRETGIYVNQYDYMKLLADRGETAKLAQVRGFLQQNGVFNPEKYRQVMTGGGGTGSSNQASGQAGVTNAQAGNKQQGTIIRKEQPTIIPQKIHRGYDDEEADPADTMKNRPIFLR